MEMEEINLDEMFDFGPIHSQMYNPSPQLQPQKLINSSKISWSSSNYNYNNGYPHSQDIINCTNPSSSSSSSAPQLVSFENLNKNTANCKPSSDLEMARDYNSLSPQIIKFSLNDDDDDDDTGDYDQQYNSQKRPVGTTVRTPLQAQDHLMAERKRREKLGQLFISLSKAVPGLKKLDKASLLEDAINHLKSLQERVNVLEKEEEENIIMMKKISRDDQESNSIINYNDNSGGSIVDQSAGPPEIKARISKRHVLLKIWCKKQTGLLSRIPSELEKMHLSVVDIRFIPFGGTALDITILAEMHNEFRGTEKGIIDHLHMVLLNPRDLVDS